jgi:regulator of protease activity HflC (stomatin/prohibitin superfamily)
MLIGILVLIVGGFLVLAGRRKYKRAREEYGLAHERWVNRDKGAEDRYNRPVEPKFDKTVGVSQSIVGLGLAGVGLLAAIIFAAVPGNFYYTQDAGTAVVQVDVLGNIIGQTDTTGAHGKAPWVDTVEYNIRNQQIVFAGKDGDQSDNSGGQAAGPQVTVQDKDGVSSNIDVAIRYSIRAGSVTDIYKEFKSEENFKTSFIEQDIRSATRLVPNGFSTIDLITDRAAVEKKITDTLTARWKSTGVSVDSVSLQEIRPPQSVVESYATAQQAQINVTTEQANLEAAKVKAQQQVVTAQAQSDANKLLAQSLTPEILTQRYLDALGKGTVYVVPEGSTPFIGTK